MRQYCGLGLATLVGAAFGAAAVNGLHAQAKPPVYLISEIEVANPAAYGAEFAPQAQAAIKAAGGRLIAIGGVAGAGENHWSPLQAPRQNELLFSNGTASSN
jgi:hypothetical protein